MNYYWLTKTIFTYLATALPLLVLLFGKNELKEKFTFVFLTIGCSFLFDYDIFGIASLAQIIPMILSLIFIFSRKNKQVQDRSIGFIKTFLILDLIYLFFTTFIFYFLSKDFVMNGGIMQNELRPIVQYVQYIFIYLSFISILYFPKETSKKLLKAFFYSIVVLCVLGIIQAAVYSITSFDLFPMRKETIESVGISRTGFNGILRITAGVGEPKQLAKFISIGIAFLLFGNEILEFGWKKKCSLLALFLITMILTSATTGYILVIAVLIILLIDFGKINIIKMIITPFLLAGIVIVLISSDVITKKLGGSDLETVFYKALENCDSALFKMLLDRPWVAITGIGIGNEAPFAFNYVDDGNMQIAYNLYTIRRGFIGIITNGGIINLICHLVVYYFLFKKIKGNKGMRKLFIYIIIMQLFLTKEAMYALQLFLLGLIYSYCKQEEKDMIEESVIENEEIN